MHVVHSSNGNNRGFSKISHFYFTSLFMLYVNRCVVYRTWLSTCLCIASHRIALYLLLLRQQRKLGSLSFISSHLSLYILGGNGIGLLFLFIVIKSKYYTNVGAHSCSLLLSQLTGSMYIYNMVVGLWIYAFHAVFLANFQFTILVNWGNVMCAC